MAAKNAFEQLPLELLHRLYAYLDTADQLRLRLVCKALRDATGRVLVANGTSDGDAVRIMTGVCLWPAGAQPDVLARLADVIATRGDAGPMALVAARFDLVDLVELTVRQADLMTRADVIADVAIAAVRARSAAVLSLLLPLNECARLPLVNPRQSAADAVNQRRWAGGYAAVLRSLVVEDDSATLTWVLDDFGGAARMRPPSVFLQALSAALMEAAIRSLWRYTGGVTEANVQVAQRAFRLLRPPRVRTQHCWPCSAFRRQRQSPRCQLSGPLREACWMQSAACCRTVWRARRSSTSSTECGPSAAPRLRRLSGVGLRLRAGAARCVGLCAG